MYADRDETIASLRIGVKKLLEYPCMISLNSHLTTVPPINHQGKALAECIETVNEMILIKAWLMNTKQEIL